MLCKAHSPRLCIQVDVDVLGTSTLLVVNLTLCHLLTDFITVVKGAVRVLSDSKWLTTGCHLILHAHIILFLLIVSLMLSLSLVLIVRVL